MSLLSDLSSKVDDALEYVAPFVLAIGIVILLSTFAAIMVLAWKAALA